MEQHRVTLRAVEPADLDFLYDLENDPDNWEVSNTRVPFSRNTLHYYLNTIQDIYNDKQLRLVVQLDGEACGLLDLFDYEAYHRRAGVGVIIAKKFRGQHIAGTAIELFKMYCFKNLDLRLIYCNILANNEASIRLFEKASFFYVGKKKDWHRSRSGTFIDELMYQFNF